MEPLLTLYITARERDTVIAALRCWQHVLTATTPNFNGLLDIAENGRECKTEGDLTAALDEDEIDDLIENRVNAAAY